MEKESHFQPYGSFITALDIFLDAEVDKLGVGDIEGFDGDKWSYFLFEEGLRRRGCGLARKSLRLPDDVDSKIAGLQDQATRTNKIMVAHRPGGSETDFNPLEPIPSAEYAAFFRKFAEGTEATAGLDTIQAHMGIPISPPPQDWVPHLKDIASQFDAQQEGDGPHLSIPLSKEKLLYFVDYARQVNEWQITQTLSQVPIPGIAQEYWKRVDAVARVMDDTCPVRIQERYQTLKEQE